MALCPGCGNEIPDPHDCPVCKAGRGSKKPRKEEAVEEQGVMLCPRCQEPLAEQDWEGVPALPCSNCRGTFFPERSLELVLDKLRATVDPVDAETALREFKDRFTRPLPDAVRYKICPYCREVMTRRNYGMVSGVIVDYCGNHGYWVDEAQFAALADFIVRGGDVLASEIGRVRERIDHGRGERGGGGSGMLERFLGLNR